MNGNENVSGTQQLCIKHNRLYDCRNRFQAYVINNKQLITRSMLASWNQLEEKSSDQERKVKYKQLSLALLVVALLSFHRFDIFVVAIQIKASLSEQVTHLAEMATMK